MVPHGAANRAAILDPPASPKKRSSIRTYLCHPAPHRCGDQEARQVNGRMYVGSYTRWVPKNEWQVRMHGAFTIPFGMSGLKETDQSCHHEGWIHLLHVNARLVDRISRDDKSRQPNSRKRNSPYDHGKERRQHRSYVTTHVNGTCHPYDHSWLP